MARIRELFGEDRTARAHPTEVDCGWQVVPDTDAGRLLQLNTYGSDDRQIAKKLSQTIQIDRRIAIELMTILRSTFDL